MCQFRLIFSSKLNVVSMKWQFFIGHWHCYCYCCCDMYILSTCKCNSLNFYVHLLSSSTHLVVFVYKSRCSWMGFIVFQVTEIVTFTNYSEFSVGLRDSNGVITSRLLSIFKTSPDFSSLKSGFSPKSWIRTSCDIFVKQTSACLHISKERQVKIPPTHLRFMDKAPSCSQARYITFNLHTTYLSHYHAMSMSYADYVKQTKTPPSELFVVCVH